MKNSRRRLGQETKVDKRKLSFKNFIDEIKKKKDKLTVLLLSLLFLFFAYHTDVIKIHPEQLLSDTITLSAAPEYRLDRNEDHYYEIYGMEYPVAFSIKSEALAIAHLDLNKVLHANDSIEVKYLIDDSAELNNENSKIELYYLKHKDRILLNPDLYYKRTKFVESRKRILFGIGGVLFLLYGFSIITRRTMYIAGAVIFLLVFIYIGLQNEGVLKPKF